MCGALVTNHAMHTDTREVDGCDHCPEYNNVRSDSPARRAARWHTFFNGFFHGCKLA